jgi:hypothetical protein
MNLEELKKFMEPYQNTLVIDITTFKVCRLVDVGEDDDDYYWILDTEEGIINSSCIIDWIPLKGYIDNEDYKRLARIWNLNNVESVC